MSEIAIYGAGVKGRALLEVIENNGTKVDFFLDQFIELKELAGRPIYRLSDKRVGKDTTIYISVHDNKTSTLHDTQTIRDKLLTLGFTRVIDFVQSVHQFPEYIKHISTYITGSWLGYDKSKMINKEKLNATKQLFNEPKSLELLDLLENFRLNLTPETYVSPDQTTQYFLDDIDIFSNIDKLRFIDAGAYVGDTISTLLTFWKHSVECIAAFEPDETNLKQLENTIINMGSNICSIIYPFAVWSKSDILHFNPSGSAGSLVDKTISDQNSVSMPAVSLDQTVFTLKPNYIKMDVEGAEKEALVGAKRIIKTFSPVLAICVYHKPEDLWEIPLYIHSINNNYDMYFRQHGHLGIETVLYCIPRDDLIKNSSSRYGDSNH